MPNTEETYFKQKANEHWQKLMENCFVIGYLKGELRSKGYTSEQLEKLEDDARKAYAVNWQA